MMKTAKRKFTLVEMLVAVGILFIMMMLLSSMLMNFTKIWKTAQSNIRIYENAQMIFNMLGQDFKTALAGNQAGREISIWWKKNDSTQTLISRVVTNTVDSQKYDEAHMLCLNPEKFGDAPLQVGYCYDADNNQLKMARSEAGGEWDASKTWQGQTAERFYTFVEGVTDFYFKVSAHNSTELPDVVLVTFSLVDAQLLQQQSITSSKVEATTRTFSRSFYLGRDRRLGAPAQVTLPSN